MKRFRFSLRFQLVAVAGIAALLAGWARFGELVLAGLFVSSLTALIVSFLMPDQHGVQKWRRRFAVVLLATFVFVASLGPASWAYTKYDPGYRESPTIRRTFTAVYDPVGRCYSFPLPAWHRCCISYIGWWMPPNAEMQDYGYGIGLRSNGGLLIVGA